MVPNMSNHSVVFNSLPIREKAKEPRKAPTFYALPIFGKIHCLHASLMRASGSVTPLSVDACTVGREGGLCTHH